MARRNYSSLQTPHFRVKRYFFIIEPGSISNFAEVKVFEAVIVELEFESVGVEPGFASEVSQVVGLHVACAEDDDLALWVLSAVVAIAVEQVGHAQGCEQVIQDVLAVRLCYGRQEFQAHAAHHCVAQIGELLDGEVRQFDHPSNKSERYLYACEKNM